jgi:hypothetical protein
LDEETNCERIQSGVPSLVFAAVPVGVLCAVLSGCASPYGIGIINSTNSTLLEIEISSGNPPGEVFGYAVPLLTPKSNTYTIGPPGNLEAISWVKWTPNDVTPRRQDVATHVPRGFDGWLIFEIGKSGVTFNRLSKAEGNERLGIRAQ